MFTGLVEEIGTIKSIQKKGLGINFNISAEKILDDLQIDDSVAVNGTCLTVIEIQSKGFVVQAVDETIRKTTLKNFTQNVRVNLERALTLNRRLGGHIVLGHIDTIGKLIAIKKEDLGTIFKFEVAPEFSKYLVRVGSICIDGVSLTLSNNEKNIFEISIIPHTINQTIIKDYKVGQLVNIELDILGKYVENLLSPTTDKQSDITTLIEKYW
jgi:riboflavin synthase